MKPITPPTLPLTARNAGPLPTHKGPHNLRQQAADAAEQFETMMSLQMVRGMQSSLEGGSLFGGGVSGDVYSGLAEWELARVLAHSASFGLKEQILRQLPKHEEPGK